LLEKDPAKRPTVREILKMQLIRRKAEEFVNETQSMAIKERSKTQVFKKNIP
jgi:hypothetical protein